MEKYKNYSIPERTELSEEECFAEFSSYGQNTIEVCLKSDSSKINSAIRILPQRTFQDLIDYLEEIYPEQSDIISFFRYQYSKPYNSGYPEYSNFHIYIYSIPHVNSDYVQNLDQVLDYVIKYKRINVRNPYNKNIYKDNSHLIEEIDDIKYTYNYHKTLIIDSVFIKSGNEIYYKPNAKEYLTKKTEKAKQKHFENVSLPNHIINDIAIKLTKQHVEREFPYYKGIKLSCFAAKQSKLNKVKTILKLTKIHKEIKDFDYNTTEVEKYLPTMLQYKIKKNSKNPQLEKDELEYKKLLPKLKKVLAQQVALVKKKKAKTNEKKS